MPATLHHHNLAQLLDEVLVEHSARPALRYAERDHTFHELGGWVDSLAALLLSRGLRRGDVIAIGHDKHALSYTLMLAAIRLGVAYVNIDVASPIARTSQTLQISAPKLLFYDDPAYQTNMAVLATTQGCELLLLDLSSLPTACERDRDRQRKCSLEKFSSICLVTQKTMIKNI